MCCAFWWWYRRTWENQRWFFEHTEVQLLKFCWFIFTCICMSRSPVIHSLSIVGLSGIIHFWYDSLILWQGHLPFRVHILLLTGYEHRAENTMLCWVEDAASVMRHLLVSVLHKFSVNGGLGHNFFVHRSKRLPVLCWVSFPSGVSCLTSKSYVKCYQEALEHHILQTSGVPSVVTSL